MKTTKIVNVRDNDELKRLCKRLKYRKHKTILCNYDSVTLDGSWSGGSRDTFALFHRDTGENITAVPVPVSTSPPPFGPKPAEYQIPEGKFVLVLGTFRGKPATLQIIGTTAIQTFGGAS